MTHEEALKLAHAAVTRGREVERQMAELKANFKAVSQATHDAFTEELASLRAENEMLVEALEFCAGTSYITAAHEVAKAALNKVKGKN